MGKKQNTIKNVILKVRYCILLLCFLVLCFKKLESRPKVLSLGESLKLIFDDRLLCSYLTCHRSSPNNLVTQLFLKITSMSP